MLDDSDVRVGTAGWSIPKASADRFAPPPGTHLARYARVFRCVEINSSFYRPHAAATYARWRTSTPADFRFAVKMPRSITHERRLTDVHDLLAAFLAETEGLGQKRGPVLIQLPPSFAYRDADVPAFLTLLRTLYEGPAAWEPRHATWFTPAVDALLGRFRIARVAADPAPIPAGVRPSGWPRLVYVRLHGSPRTYWSRYDAAYITALADALRGFADAQERWCVFDNTAAGAAVENAWELRERLVLR